MNFKFFKVLKINKEKKFEPILKVERRFSITTDKNYGLCFYLEGQMPGDFRMRLRDFNYKDTWLIVYKKKGNKLVLDGLITNDKEKIIHIEQTYEVIKKISIGSLFYIDIYFENKEIALKFESLFNELYVNYINDKYKEYQELIINEKEDWLKKNN